MATYIPHRRTEQGTEPVKFPVSSIAEDNTLSTKKKDLIGAINELNSKKMLNVTVSTSPSSTMSAIISAIEEAGGDLAESTFVSFTGYLSGNIYIKFIHYGGNTYKVECIDIGNVTKIYNPETDNVINVSSTRIEDFLSYTVNDGLPEYTEENEGHFLSIVDGVAKWIELPVAEDIVIDIAEEITFNE